MYACWQQHENITPFVRTHSNFMYDSHDGIMNELQIEFELSSCFKKKLLN
jgi:hypothetical protein